jgi:hypothetical protein
MAQDQPFDPHADLDASGIDLNRLRRNRLLTPEEQLERNRKAAAFLLECKRAAQSARLSKTDNGP